MISEELKNNYSRFAQYYIEIADEVKGLSAEMEELTSENEVVPESLKNEFYRHSVILDILTQAGEEIYNKQPKQIYHDGWNFWFKEDAELRAERYGRK